MKFYTQEGNFDLVGNNIPVFFIQDSIKFPDFVHAVKPEPDNEIPQAASAHDTFWDFVSLNTEATHMVLWAMSDRALPRSYRMMEGFGVHTFRLVNEEGVSHFVKWHWKPLLGVHAVAWDEAQNISGKDPDFHRRDLWDAIEAGEFPEWELGLQIIPEEDEHKFEFDLLDPTKIVPEELVPVIRVGKMTLNRNPDNFFAETEQVAFHLVTSFQALTSPTTRFCRDACSHTPIRSSRVWADPTFTRYPLTAPLRRCITINATAFIAPRLIKAKAVTVPTPLVVAVRFWRARWMAVFHLTPNALMRIKCGNAVQVFRSFQPGETVFHSQSEPENSTLLMPCVSN